MNLGERLKQERLELNLSIEKVSEQTKISRENY